MSHLRAARIHSIPEHGAGGHYIIALGLECDDCNRSLKFDPSGAVIGCGITGVATQVKRACGGDVARFSHVTVYTPHRLSQSAKR